jgi:hypothetical protein
MLATRDSDAAVDSGGKAGSSADGPGFTEATVARWEACSHEKIARLAPVLPSASDLI